MTRQRCTSCHRPQAEQEDIGKHPEDGGQHLCWRVFEAGRDCSRDPVCPSAAPMLALDEGEATCLDAGGKCYELAAECFSSQWWALEGPLHCWRPSGPPHGELAPYPGEVS